MLLHLMRSGRPLFGIMSGAAWGVAFLCRPLTAVVIAGVFGLVALSRPRKVFGNLHGFVALIAAALPFLALYLLFQYAITGDWLAAGHAVGMGPRGRFGLVELDGARTHTLAIGLAHTGWRIKALNDDVLGWPIPALLLAALPLVLRRRRLPYLISLLPVFALLCAYCFYWYYECYFPARYTAAGVPMLLIPIARTLVFLPAVARRRSAVAEKLFGGIVVSCVLFSLVVSAPCELDGYDSRFGDVEGRLPKVMEAHDVTHAVVFMDQVGKAVGLADPSNDYYATGFMRNDLDLEGDVIYARNSRGENVKMFEVYPDRSYYLYRYMRHADAAVLWRLVPEGEGFELIPVGDSVPDAVRPDRR